MPVVAVAGYVEPDVRRALDAFGVSGALSVYDKRMNLEQILPTCKTDLGRRVEDLAYLQV